MKTIESKEVYRCKIFSVTHDKAVDAKTGFQIERSIVRHNGSAVMMAVDDAKRILLVRQFRLPARKYMWELPAGKVDEGEKPLQTARRELIEETGYRAGIWKKLGSFFVSPGYVQERMTIYLATGLKSGEATPMEDEQIEARWFTQREIEKLILSGKLDDAKTIIGFFLYRARRR
jgi:ADP-ribose pyrophosphatase